jgi:integrase
MSTLEYVDVDRTLENLTDEIHPANEQAIHAYVDHCAAEGISEVQQVRQIQSLKTLLTRFSPDGFRLQDATEQELKAMLAGMNRSDYAEATKHKFKSTVKKFYKVQNGGEHPEKVDFFTTSRKKETTVTRDDLFTDAELAALFRSFSSTRDRAFALALYESGARPGELLACTISDFTVNGKGDFIFLEGLKNTPDRTNQLVRAGRTIREWLAHHPLGGELGGIQDPAAPLWVKTEQQRCTHCDRIPHQHTDTCEYTPELADPLKYDGMLRRFKDACNRAGIPANKQRPYNLRHTRLTEVATFMGYEQLNKFAGWTPGSNRAKVYVHLNNEDVNRAIRDQYGLDTEQDEPDQIDCPFCNASNQPGHTECRQCGRPLSLEQQAEQEEKMRILERLQELEEKGVLEKLADLDDPPSD